MHAQNNPAQSHIPLIGLSGLSGAGKNVAAEILQKHALFAIDADHYAHAVLREHEQEIIAQWRSRAEARNLVIYNADNSLNRSALGKLLFSEPAYLAEHERFVFPFIERDIRKKVQEIRLSAKPPPAILLNAPTLHKTALLDDCRFILWIHAPLLLRLFRIYRRDKIPVRNILARFSRQKDFYPQYLKKNVDIIYVSNCGTQKRFEINLLKKLRRKGIEV